MVDIDDEPPEVQETNDFGDLEGELDGIGFKVDND